MLWFIFFPYVRSPIIFQTSSIGMKFRFVSWSVQHFLHNEALNDKRLGEKDRRDGRICYAVYTSIVTFPSKQIRDLQQISFLTHHDVASPKINLSRHNCSSLIFGLFFSKVYPAIWTNSIRLKFIVESNLNISCRYPTLLFNSFVNCEKPSYVIQKFQNWSWSQTLVDGLKGA